MGLFTRVGLYCIGVFFLIMRPVWAESVPYLGTSETVQTFNATEGTGTFRANYSGSSNAFGKYTCTGSGSLTFDTSGSCGSDALGFSFSYNDIECSTEGIDYPYTVDVDNPVVCVPLSCYSSEPPHPLAVGCSYSFSWTGTIMGGDGVMEGITGNITAMDTYTVRWEENDGVTFRSRITATTSGTADIEFIEPEEEEPARGFNLGIPAPGSTVNGIGLISGWSCLGGELKAEIIDAGEVVDTVVLNHGSSRTDTEGVCGDSNNGFSATVNWNHYAAGEKTVRLFHNGEEADSHTFSILRLSEDEFLTGASGMCVVNNFPNTGQETTIEWDESRQGFFPTGIR